MKCPFCLSPDTSVLDSRLSKDGLSVRRRRACALISCHKRFTTYERVGELLPVVVKKDGRREVFDRLKIVSGLKKACEKRPISIEKIEHAADKIEQQVQEKNESEVTSSFIGEEVMKQLKLLDPVAYVRFASVYRSFQDVGEFVNEIRDLTNAVSKEI